MKINLLKTKINLRKIKFGKINLLKIKPQVIGPRINHTPSATNTGSRKIKNQFGER